MIPFKWYEEQLYIVFESSEMQSIVVGYNEYFLRGKITLIIVERTLKMKTRVLSIEHEDHFRW